MKTGVSTLFAIQEKRLLLDSVEALQEKRVRTIELVCEKPHSYEVEEVAALKRLDLDYSVHSPFRSDNMQPVLPGFSVPSPGLVERSLIIAEELEATHYVAHSGDVASPELLEDPKTNERFLEAFRDKFEGLFKKAADAGVTIALENTRPSSLFGKIENIARLKEELGLGFCLDVAHAEAYKQASAELLELRPEYVHVSDNTLTKDSHLTVGEGKINFRRWFYKLKKIGFDGKIVVECYSLEDSIASVNRINDLLERLRLK